MQKAVQAGFGYAKWVNPLAGDAAVPEAQV
jgi:hypothetical protein